MHGVDVAVFRWINGWTNDVAPFFDFLSEGNKIRWVQVVFGLDGAFALEPEWERLYDLAVHGTPFLHPVWALTWARLFVAPTDVVTLVARTGDTVVGIAPFYWRRLPGGAVSLQLLGANRQSESDGVSFAPVSEDPTL